MFGKKDHLKINNESQTNNKPEDIKDVRDSSSYESKISKSIIRIISSLVITAIFLCFIFGLGIYRSMILDSDDKNITELKKYILIIGKETSEANKNLNLARKYNKRWEEAKDSQKSNQGIDSNLINVAIKDLAKKYNIPQYDFKMSIPERVENPSIANKALEIYYSNCQLGFTSADDVRAIALIKDLKAILNGYFIINDLSVTKLKEYNYDDFVKISKGEDPAIFSIRVNFKWYASKKVQKSK